MVSVVLLLLSWWAARSAIEYAQDTQERLVALNTNSGRVLWVAGGQFAGELAVDGDRVFVFDEAQRWRNWLAHFNVNWR